jgi:hypothetical protein
MTQVSISDVWLPPDGVYNEVATPCAMFLCDVLLLAIASCATMHVRSSERQQGMAPCCFLVLALPDISMNGGQKCAMLC